MKEALTDMQLGYEPIRISPQRLAKAAFALSGAALVAAALLAGTGAIAQTSPSYANEFSRPYGLNPGDETRPYDPRTRDLNGNRVIVDGVMVVGDDLSALPLGLYNSGNGGMGFSGTGMAIGNQLNVTTTGSFNNVVVNSNQINNGNQTVIINAGSSSGTTTTASNSASQVLNGELNF